MSDILNNVEKNALIDEIGKQSAGKAQEVIDKAQKSIETLLEQNSGKFASKEDVDKFKEISTKANEELTNILKEQGKTLADFRSSIEFAGTKNATGYAELMEANRDEIDKLVADKRTFDVELKANKEGKIVAIRKDYSENYNKILSTKLPKETVKSQADAMLQKAAGITGSVDLLSGVGSVASIASALTAASILRIGSAASNAMVSQFRNTPFIFDLCTTSTVPITTATAVWMEETLAQFGVATVAEGATKPLSQTTYTLQSNQYKKKAHYFVITDEFINDFALLEAKILQTGLTELTNAIQVDVITDMFAKATAYNTATQFKAGVVVPNVNDYDALAALSAQSRYATFGSYPNGALMGSFKSDRMGIAKDTQGRYLGVPPSIEGLQFIGNRAVDDINVDNVLVGDFKQYNVQFKGGVIVRTGYNGNDLINNQMTTVIEQYYFNYISAIKAAALVKGTTFAAVKTAISA